MTENTNNASKAISKKETWDITDKNWLMLKHIQEGKKIYEAHQLAGYTGTKSAAYNLYHQLKKKLEKVYEADNVDSLRLKIAAKKILDMPVEDKPIKPETQLKAIETLHKLQDKDKEDKKVISPFIVFKSTDGEIQASQGKVIDVKEVEISKNNAEE